MPGAAPLPSVSTLGALSSSSLRSVSMDFVCLARLLCHVSSVCGVVVCTILSQIAQWLLLVDDLLSLSIFLWLWIQREELLVATEFHSVRGELGTYLSLAGRKCPLASGFRHVGLLAW